MFALDSSWPQYSAKTRALNANAAATAPQANSNSSSLCTKQTHLHRHTHTDTHTFTTCQTNRHRHTRRRQQRYNRTLFGWRRRFNRVVGWTEMVKRVSERQRVYLAECMYVVHLQMCVWYLCIISVAVKLAYQAYEHEIVLFMKSSEIVDARQIDSNILTILNRDR